jgi:Ca2+-transporting ATPase
VEEALNREIANLVDLIQPPALLRGAEPSWHTMSAHDTAAALDVAPGSGLSQKEAARRLRQRGKNVLVGKAAHSVWRRILVLLTDRLTVVLIIAAVVSAVVSRDWETPAVILLVVAVNAGLNVVQENRAENSLEALRRTSVATSRVRRDGKPTEVPSAELVPGDIVLLDAGDAVPADGRLIETIRLQIAESALTGESTPVDKDAQLLSGAGLPHPERMNMAYMNTEVSRGRGVLAVTATGMSTWTGSIASLLDEAGGRKTPVQRRTDQLARTLSIVAAIVVTIVFVAGLLRGQSWNELLLTAVALAVATIPEGLTAVVAFTLAMGASRLARHGAIIKQLSAVETLGSTTHIATDKTGTLTLNQMTARRLITIGHSFDITGEGYSIEGSILHDGAFKLPSQCTDAFLAMALCNDATVSAGEIIGDPTEAALVVLATKGGVDVEALRRQHPRIAEIPFDSDYKFMATFHGPDFSRGDESRCFAKGAPVAILGRAGSILTERGIRPLTDDDRSEILAGVHKLAEAGLRTLMIAGRRIGAPLPADPERLREDLVDLTVYAVVGIEDPPRIEAAAAIAIARGAGITIHMITGDHEITATTIANRLGIPGASASGRDLDSMNQEELVRRAPDYGVLARVSPEHKIRLVRALQNGGQVVAMTGDGVNDAPALKQADLGIAMGITGSDVSKGAANMVLTDDNFTTIVTAIEIGRGVYANIIKFVQFQLTTAWGFVLIFVMSATLGLPGGAPFTALQILLVNLIMDGPPALALGLDKVESGIMKRKPRPVDEPLLTRGRILRILLLGVVMAAGTGCVLVFSGSWFGATAGHPLQPTTLAFTTFVLFQLFNLLNVRSDVRSAFSRATFSNRAVWLAIAVVVLLQAAVVNVGMLQGLFATTALTAPQWLVAAAIASSVLWVEEIRKWILRKSRPGRRRGASARSRRHPSRSRQHPPGGDPETVFG